jgi:hypothetical protein
MDDDERVTRSGIMGIEERMRSHLGPSPNISGKVWLRQYAPYRKVSAGALAGALSIILVWVVNAFVLPESNPLPGEVASAITTVLTFVVGYVVPEA